MLCSFSNFTTLYPEHNSHASFLHLIPSLLRWRPYCQERITAHWDQKLKQEAETKQSLVFLDFSSLSLTKPAKLWSMAGLEANEIKKACIVNWMTLGVFRTGENLYKMKKAKFKMCTACPKNAIGSLEHYLLYCEFVKETREKFLPQFILSNPEITNLFENEVALMISILSHLYSQKISDITGNQVQRYTLYHVTICTMYTENLTNSTKKQPEVCTNPILSFTMYKL